MSSPVGKLLMLASQFKCKVFCFLFSLQRKTFRSDIARAGRLTSCLSRQYYFCNDTTKRDGTVP